MICFHYLVLLFRANSFQKLFRFAVVHRNGRILVLDTCLLLRALTCVGVNLRTQKEVVRLHSLPDAQFHYSTPTWNL